jgi:putative SOS response-associated peptidase YedK
MFASGAQRTSAITPTDTKELVADMHDRMPVILAPADYVRWLGEEPDPASSAAIKSPYLNHRKV